MAIMETIIRILTLRTIQTPIITTDAGVIVLTQIHKQPIIIIRTTTTRITIGGTTTPIQTLEIVEAIILVLENGGIAAHLQLVEEVQEEEETVVLGEQLQETPVEAQEEDN